jgi:hypothetical protein
MKKLLLGIVGLILCTQLLADNLSAQYFAYNMTLNANNSHSPLYQLPLPAKVYAHMAYANLSDIRVFNTQGEPLSVFISHPEIAQPLLGNHH